VVKWPPTLAGLPLLSEGLHIRDIYGQVWLQVTLKLDTLNPESMLGASLFFGDVLGSIDVHKPVYILVFQ
jgi:hypothetical protein